MATCLERVVVEDAAGPPAAPAPARLEGAVDDEASLLAQCTVDTQEVQRLAQRESGAEEPRWTAAMLQHPAMEGMKRLSALSAHDLPDTALWQRPLKTDIPHLHPEAAPLAALTPAAKAVPFDPELPVLPQAGTDPVARFKERAGVRAKTAPNGAHPVALMALGGLSEETLARHPDLSALVRFSAKTHRAQDPSSAAQATAVAKEMDDRARLALPEPTQQEQEDAAVAAAEARAVARYGTRPAPPLTPPHRRVLNPNKCFGPSDVVHYEHLRAERAAESAAAARGRSGDIALATDTVSSGGLGRQGASVHSRGGVTAFEAEVEKGAPIEDLGEYLEQREDLTAALGHYYAVLGRVERLSSDQRGAERERALLLSGRQQLPTPVKRPAPPASRSAEETPAPLVPRPPQAPRDVTTAGPAAPTDSGRVSPATADGSEAPTPRRVDFGEAREAREVPRAVAVAAQYEVAAAAVTDAVSEAALSASISLM